MTDEKNEPAGTVLLGSMNRRTYLYVSQSAERMERERRTAYEAGVQDLRDFVFVLDGERIELTYDELKARLTGRAVPCIQCGGIVKPRQGGICLPCVGEGASASEEPRRD